MKFTFMKFTYRVNAARTRRLLYILSAVMAACLLGALPMVALAHPLGNFTVNRYSRIDATNQVLQLTHIIDMAEIPTHQERLQIDLNHDGAISEQEEQRYLDQLTTSLRTDLQMRINGEAASWQLLTQQLRFPIGQAGLPTLRVVTTWQTVPTTAARWQVDFQDRTFADRLGWQEVVVRGGDSANIVASTAPTRDVSNELTSYPVDLLQSPLAINGASFQVAPLAAARGEGRQQAMTDAGAAVESAFAPVTVVRSALPADPFAELINITTLSPLAILLALLAAFGWGAAHAFSPGHGKTVVAAYLVGSRGTVGHALFLGITTTITHTAGVFLLGIITLFASRYILPETLYPWLSVLSGLLVVAIGLSMVRQRWLRPSDGHQHHDHDHQHDYDHPHDHGHDHEHGHGLLGHHHHHGDHSHMPPGVDGAPVTWRTLLALGISGGLLPCPSALVLMLGAISLNRVGFGLALIVLFSLGLASVLTAIGITLVYAGKYFQRIPESGRLFRLLPVASAIIITAIGLGITMQALLTTGTLRLV